MLTPRFQALALVFLLTLQNNGMYAAHRQEEQKKQTFLQWIKNQPLYIKASGIAIAAISVLTIAHYSRSSHPEHMIEANLKPDRPAGRPGSHGIMDYRPDKKHESIDLTLKEPEAGQAEKTPRAPLNSAMIQEDTRAGSRWKKLRKIIRFKPGGLITALKNSKIQQLTLPATSDRMLPDIVITNLNTRGRPEPAPELMLPHSVLPSITLQQTALQSVPEAVEDKSASSAFEQFLNQQAQPAERAAPLVSSVETCSTQVANLLEEKGHEPVPSASVASEQEPPQATIPQPLPQSVLPEGKQSTSFLAIPEVGEEKSEHKKALSYSDRLKSLQEKLTPFKNPKYRNRHSKEYTQLKNYEKLLKKKSTTTSAFEQFCSQYAPPTEIATEIEKNFKERGLSYLKLQQYPSSKDRKDAVIYKGNDIGRIINAERLRTCIQEHKLDRLKVPRKYVYKINNNWHVFAEIIQKDTHTTFVFDDFKQLATIAEETGYRDWGNGGRANTLIDKKTKQVAFIDTEDFSFIPEGLTLPNIPKNCKINFFYPLRFFDYLGLLPENDELTQEVGNFDYLGLLPENHELTQEVGKFYNTRLNQLKQSTEGTEEHLPLPLSTRFDPPGIDFEKVKKEYAQLCGR